MSIQRIVVKAKTFFKWKFKSSKRFVTKQIFTFFALLFTFLSFGAGTKKAVPLGTVENPVKIYLTPAADAKIIEGIFKGLKEYLEENTNLKFAVIVPKLNSEIIEAFGTNQVDVAAMTTFAYAKAYNIYKAQARLTVSRQGATTYQSEFIVRADSKIKKLEDIAGKKIAFVDTSSMSGYLLPLKTLKDKKIEPKEFVMHMELLIYDLPQMQII